MISLFGPSKEKANKAFNRGFETGDFEPALKLYKQLVEKDPDDYESLHNTGYIFLCLDRGEEAVEYFLKANKIHESPVHWNNIGRSYQKIKKFPEACEAYSKAMQLDNKNPQPRYNLTVCLREMGDIEKSFSELKILLQNHPDHAGANNDLALHYEEQGVVDKSIPHLKKALKSDPNYAPSRLNLIRILCERGDFPASTEHLEYLAQQGAHVEVAADNGKAKISINGSILFEGPYET